jgi:ribosomal protein S18 acetylase RimI-like enzyme
VGPKRVRDAGPAAMEHAPTIRVRPAKVRDESELARIDALTWTAMSSPAPPPAPGARFFDDRTLPGDVLVGELDRRPAGYARLGQSIPLASHAHVQELKGLAVDPAHQRRGLGRALVQAAMEEARRRGGRKLTLRVLAHNDDARRLYAACGFRTEGILHGEFHLGGAYVDDLLMARELAPG